MRVEVSMTPDEDKFYTHGWWATAPGYVLGNIRQQLKAAAVVWPELDNYEIKLKRSKKTKPKAP